MCNVRWQWWMAMVDGGEIMEGCLQEEVSLTMIEMATIEKTLELTGKSGTIYRFFPQYPLAENRDSKGAGIYVFTDKSGSVADIQFLVGEEEVTATLQRLKEDGADAFYFRDKNEGLSGDDMIDDIKNGDDYRKKSD